MRAAKERKFVARSSKEMSHNTQSLAEVEAQLAS